MASESEGIPSAFPLHLFFNIKEKIGSNCDVKLPLTCSFIVLLFDRYPVLTKILARKMHVNFW